MKAGSLLFFVCLCCHALTGAQADSVTDRLLAGYERTGNAPLNAKSGQRLWNREFVPTGSAKPRSCATCHTANPRAGGRHVRTGKNIKALAPTANPKRFTTVSKVRKWFKRNCKWTLGRECSATEKGNILLYLTGL